jgi:hypothetical protein
MDPGMDQVNFDKFAILIVNYSCKAYPAVKRIAVDLSFFSDLIDAIIQNIMTKN